jgi:hypothetical protein
MSNDEKRQHGHEIAGRSIVALVTVVATAAPHTKGGRSCPMNERRPTAKTEDPPTRCAAGAGQRQICLNLGAPACDLEMAIPFRSLSPTLTNATPPTPFVATARSATPISAATSTPARTTRSSCSTR